MYLYTYIHKNIYIGMEMDLEKNTDKVQARVDHIILIWKWIEKCYFVSDFNFFLRTIY